MHSPLITQVKRAYKALKEFNKALKSVDKELHLAYNHKASKAAEAASGLLRGMGLESGGLHALVKLKQCTALSGMKMNDDAIEACDQAIEMKPANLCEAYRIRAKAHLKDNNYEEAVDDFRHAKGRQSLQLMPIIAPTDCALQNSPAKGKWMRWMRSYTMPCTTRSSGKTLRKAIR